MVIIAGLFLQCSPSPKTQSVPELSISVHTNSGSLSSIIGGRTNEITDLTLTGDLWSNDIECIRGMAEEGSLTKLDLSGVTIADKYYDSGYYRSQGAVFFMESYNQLPDAIFRDCKKLKSIILPSRITSIGFAAFSDCAGLTNITIPNSVTLMGISAFENCTGLTNITIPINVTSIEISAFAGCSELTSVIFPENIKIIKSSAFSGTKLTEIHIKNPTPPRIDSSSFDGINKKTCKLYVPIGSRNAYWLAWGFDNIIEMN